VPPRSVLGYAEARRHLPMFRITALLIAFWATSASAEVVGVSEADDC